MPRLMDRELSNRLDNIGAVEVAGTMWSGKTWTSMAYGESISRIGLQPVRLSAEADPRTVLQGDRPHVIDDWQDVPEIWDAVRASVDEQAGKPGQYILTGSSMAGKERVHHSGAGRISRLRMRTMSLQESGFSTGSVSLSRLFQGRFEPSAPQQSLLPIAEYICRGGWPALIRNRDADSHYLLESYFDALFEVSIPRMGLRGTDARSVALALARNQGSAVTLSTLAADARFSQDNSKGANEKVSNYISALEKLYVIEEVTGWDAPIRSKSRLRTKPKYYYTDPSLAAFLLDISPSRLLEDGQLFGVLFENLSLRDLAVYASVLPGAASHPLHYYRDSDGLEVDAILEMRDGRWAALEIKLGENKFEEGAAALNRLKRKVAANPAAQNPEPSFLAVITGAGEFARYDARTGVYLIPITVLGA